MPLYMFRRIYVYYVYIINYLIGFSKSNFEIFSL